MTDPAKIAATLTEKEKECLTGWPTILGAAYNMVCIDLNNKRLLDDDWRLTALGRSIRDHLLAEQAKPEPPREFRVGDRVRHVNANGWGVGMIIGHEPLSGVFECQWPRSSPVRCLGSNLIIVPDPTAETFFAPDYVTPVGEMIDDDDECENCVGTGTIQTACDGPPTFGFAPCPVCKPLGEPVEPDNPRAFPSGAIDDRYGGMTLRDWFAGQMLAGIGAWAPNNPDGTASSDPKAMRVKYCYEMADAMLAERVKV